MAKHGIGGKYSITEAEILALNPKIKQVEIKEEGIIIHCDNSNNLTMEELDNIIIPFIDEKQILIKSVDERLKTLELKEVA